MRVNIKYYCLSLLGSLSLKVFLFFVLILALVMRHYMCGGTNPELLGCFYVLSKWFPNQGDRVFVISGSIKCPSN